MATVITGAQLRAARGMLDWTRLDLAKAAGISPETVKNIEHGVFRPQEETANRILRAFEEQHVEFTAEEGVKMKRDSVLRFEGGEGFRRFIDDVYETAKLPGSAIGGDKPICISACDDGLFTQYLGDYFVDHARRMGQLKGVKVRILTKDVPTFKLAEETAESSYREYRLMDRQKQGNVPFYVYGDKLGILVFNQDKITITVVYSESVAGAYRDQFNVLWEYAKPLEQGHDLRGAVKR